MIFDVIIDKRHRGKGLGKILIENILNLTELKNVKNFELYCLEDMTSFYKKYGFEKISDNLTFMRKSN